MNPNMDAHPVIYGRLKPEVEKLGIDYLTVWRAYRRGTLPKGVVTRVGGSLYVNVERFKNLLAEGGK